jgi:hypothetical protein
MRESVRTLRREIEGGRFEAWHRRMLGAQWRLTSVAAVKGEALRRATAHRSALLRA